MTLLGNETLRAFHNGNPIIVRADEVGKKYRQVLVPALLGHDGTTAGWVVGDGDIGHATLPAGVTAGTFVIPIPGLEVGDTITAFNLIGQVESAGNTVTIDAAIRKLTAVAADNTDASVAAITQISVIADTLLSSAQAKTGLTELVADGTMYYLLITATTAASTDIALLGAIISVTKG